MLKAIRADCHAYTRSDMNESPSLKQPAKSDETASISTFVVPGRAMQREGDNANLPRRRLPGPQGFLDISIPSKLLLAGS